MFRIEGAAFAFDKELLALTLTLTGEKTSGTSKFGYDIFVYQLCDGSGYVVETSWLYLENLRPGDRFKDHSVQIYNITPGESYIFRLSEYVR